MSSGDLGDSYQHKGAAYHHSGKGRQIKMIVMVEKELYFLEDLMGKFSVS